MQLLIEDDSQQLKSETPLTEIIRCKQHSPRVHLFCFDLSHHSKNEQFCLCAAVVLSLFLVYGYVLESIFNLESYKSSGWYVTLLQFSCYAIFAFIERKIRRESFDRKIPIFTYTQLALYTVGTIGLSNASLNYLNYPTNVIFKSCKLIPVLIGGIFIQGKRYSYIDFLAAGCMSFGLIFFTLANVEVAPNFNIKGYICLSLALIADALIGNVQEKEMKRHNATNSEMLLYSYSIGWVYLLVVNLFMGDLFAFLLKFNQDSPKFYLFTMIMSIVGFFGIDVIVTMVKTFGAFPAMTVTTFRKAVTIVLSFLIFAKPFTLQHVWSGGIVFLGVYISAFAKQHEIIRNIYSYFVVNKQKTMQSV